MERLTVKTGIGYLNKLGGTGRIYTKDDLLNDFDRCIQKLGKLEDIEEELGIPLEVLFKALKQGKIYTRASEYDKYSFHFIRGANMQSIHCISKVCPYPDCDFGVDLKDYGKTWSLTREELESAKD